MNSLLEKINDIASNETFADKINQNDYIQSISMNNGETYQSRNIVDLILMKYEPLLSFGEIDKLEIEKEKVKIVENLEKDYQQYKFNKKILSLKKIQNGFQNRNSLSSIYFLSEYYKKNFCIIDGTTTYFTNYKNYEKEYLLMKNEKFSFKDTIDTNNGYTGLFHNESFHKDITSELIYETDLKPISKYTITELREISSNKSINLKLNKKDLYHELYKLNLN
jgi:hypothetical protein